MRLPGRNGVEVCANLRQVGNQTPILMLTARGEVSDRVRGLNAGADDYLVKPFDLVELLARMAAVLRRARADSHGAANETEVYHFGPTRIDFVRKLVLQDGKPLSLHPLEYRLLSHFVRNRLTTFSRIQLLGSVWGYGSMPLTRTVDVHIAGLRRKIEPDPRRPRYLLTVHGLGYKFIG